MKAIEIPVRREFVERCHRCQGTEHLIIGDSAIVCRPCIDLLGGIAGDPERADNRILTALVERHGDVVSLRREPSIRGRSAPLRWIWDPTWPDVEPRPQ